MSDCANLPEGSRDDRTSGLRKGAEYSGALGLWLTHILGSER
jgi:hypothetical protein